MSVTSLLQYAFEKFDVNEYDDAIKAFMAAYTASDDLKEKSDIFGVLSENFIEPNRQEFKDAYDSNIETLKSKKCLGQMETPKYEELSLEMIPVSDEKYYIWDSRANSFWGSESITLKKVFSGRKKLFDSIIIDGFSDMRSILTEMSEYEYAHVYFVIEEEDTLNRFFSFFAIPNMSASFNENMHIFHRREDLIAYLDETGNYIPKTIKRNNDFDYSKMMDELHRKRIKGSKKKRPFVAIAIPTKNRGKKMLENIRRLQQLTLDEEIEFVISNNTSTKETEYYDEIEKLSNDDSRIRYEVLPSDYFADSFVNVLRLINAEYGIFCSDEDFLVLDRITDAIQEIYEHQEYGVITLGTDAGNVRYYHFDKGFSVEKGTPGLQGGLGCNYITGLCINMKYLLSKNIIDQFIHDFKDKNEYYKYYTHSVYIAYLGYHRGIYATDIDLFFDTNCGVENNAFLDGEFRLKHVLVEERIKQATDQINVILYFKLPYDVEINGIFYVFTRLFSLTRIAYGHYYDEMMKRHTWQENCKIISAFFNEVMERLVDEGVIDQKTVEILRENFLIMCNREISDPATAFD